jgi:hypothetical protein
VAFGGLADEYLGVAYDAVQAAIFFFTMLCTQQFFFI